MAGISVSGLISNSFDWKAVVDQLIAIDSVPIARLQSEQAKNNDKLASLGAIRSYMTDLQTSAISLRSSTLFKGRTVSSSSPTSSWTLGASSGATAGSYSIAVSQLATAARRVGTSGASAGLSTTSDVSGVTLATAKTATAITAGNFTVNGKTVSIALTDSLADVFTKISTATDGKVTGTYNATTDKITLANTDGGDTTAIELGAANDSSNFLSAMRLGNNGGTSVTSSAKLGTTNLGATIADSGLGASLDADENGNGSFSINGVTISYNVNTDTVRSVLRSITNSTAGVTASYDSTNDRFVLTNKSTGDTGVGANEISGGLLDAMGLTSASTLERGKNAIFTVDGGDAIESMSNTLTSTAHGVTGLSVKVDSLTTQTITVAPDTAAMKAAITDFIDKFNLVQQVIDEETAVTKGEDGKMNKAILGGNQEVEGWGKQLRSMAFATISGLSTTMDQLADIGIDFDSINSTLKIKDTAKFDAALADNSEDINGFFTNASTGFAQKFSVHLTGMLSSSSGAIVAQSNTLSKQNTSIDAQIVVLNRRLESQRELLTRSFLAMQDAQSSASNQQKTIDDMFFKKSSDS